MHQTTLPSGKHQVAEPNEPSTFAAVDVVLGDTDAGTAGSAAAIGATRALRDSVITLAATVFAILEDMLNPSVDLDPAVGIR
ncbi:hypothetical protein EBN03_07560 [Nocardia stercoris]|uniref:Uncharacterized protein n=1 Tax=Nocardia stercoris TaxID=2483361 RepID=A0A3M2LE52_9NOCA|nr:hypothetical protein EBN03_07560 [Nocardia stercoris]